VAPGLLPLAEGSSGAPVVDVQQRLADLGFPAVTDPGGVFGPGTRAAVEAFQHRRGLRVDGVCGRQTWGTLVEAGYCLGARALYRTTPMARGDDVAELQQRLGALGFDTGRVDGIFGDLTAAAVSEFQRNAGLPVDGIVGATTVAELLRVQAPHREPEPVAAVRDRERLRQSPPTLFGRRLAIGEVGGLGATVAALHRRLSDTGARVTELHHPDGSHHAEIANAAEADVYVGLRLDPDQPGCSTAFYSGYRYESQGGRRLASLVQRHVPGALGVPDRDVHGMSLPVLRETRMPAVIVEIGPATTVVEGGPALARALTAAMVEWAQSTWD
jgi:N-acetylmuramoyl-L-alanine amidase